MNYLPLLLVFFSISCYTQSVYEAVTHQTIYGYIDELANQQIIKTHSAVKPYTRKDIAEWLRKAGTQQHLLNLRQRKELNFYLREFEIEYGKLEKSFFNFYHIDNAEYQYNFRPSTMRYCDSLFRTSVRPILGIEYGNNQYGTISHGWFGIEGFAYIGNVGVYASIRENDEEHRILSDPLYLNTRKAAIYERGDDYTEAQGGITYTWQWGYAGLVKDDIRWGNHYHYPSVISGKVPSFTQLKLRLQPIKWLTFDYFHAWLSHGISDTTMLRLNRDNQSGTIGYADQNKYLAANMFTFRVFEHTHLSLGNMVVYLKDSWEPGLLFPLFFYGAYNNAVMITGKEAEELPQNAQLFLDISIREIRKLHIYGTLLLDDFELSRMTNAAHKNLFSLNAGIRVDHLLPNIFITLEYYYANPLVYQHELPGLAFESYDYNMGHYLRDNSEQLYGNLLFKPFKNTLFSVEYTYGVHGPDYGESGIYRTDLAFIEQVEWKRREFRISFRYEVFYNISFYGALTHANISGKREKYTLPFFHGNTQTFSAGFQYGF